MVESSPVKDVRVGGRLQLLDYLRLFAAAVVVCFHYFFNGIGASIQGYDYTSFSAVAKYGFLGVELFFLISGFVIFNSAHGKTARQFAVGRVLRLYPAYWFAVLTTAIVIMLFGDVSDLEVSARQVLINLTMLQGTVGVAPVDGVYWTLLLELQFYFVVFLLLLFRRGNRLGDLLPIWVAAMLFVALVAPPLADLPLLGGHFFLFAGGALIALIRHDRATTLRVVALAVAAVMASRYASFSTEEIGIRKDVEFSSVVVVTIILASFLTLLASCSERVANWHLPAAKAVGALTYPLYLLHAYIGFIALSQLAAVGVPEWAAYPAVIVGVVVLARLVHIFVERLPAAWWRGFFEVTVGRTVGLVDRAR